MMPFYLSSLKGVSGIYTFVNEAEAYEKLVNRGGKVFYFNNGLVKLHPDRMNIPIHGEEKESLNTVHNYDVIEIELTGVVNTVFSWESSDNALVITSCCNSNCVICPSSENSRKCNSPTDIKRLLEIIEYIPGDANHLTITGGEPTLIGEELIQLLYKLKEKFTRTEFLLLTNGRSFSNKEYASALINSFPNNTTIAIPIYGYDEQTHDGITNAKGSFREAYLGIKRLLRAGQRVEIRVVVSKLNFNHIDKVSELICNNFKGIKCVNFIGLEMRGNAARNKDKVWIDYSQAFNAIEGPIRILVNSGIDVGIYNFPLCAVGRAYWWLCRRSISDYKVKYYEECDECSVKKICGGVFESTKTIVDIGVNPIKQTI